MKQRKPKQRSPVLTAQEQEMIIIRPDKRERYNETMDITGIHTLSGTSALDVLAAPPDIVRTVKANVKRKVRNKDEYETYLQLNPNKLGAEQKIITEYTKFTDAITYILDGMGLAPDDFHINRADLCFNSTDPESFAQYQKLHRLLICCIADKYSFKNCYQSQDLFSYDGLSVAIKNDRYEIENYDKERESDSKDECKNRLELRSKKMQHSTIRHEFIDLWMCKLDEAIGNYKSVQQRYNMNLERLYKLDLAKPKQKRRYLNLTAFLLQYQECIFCRAQLIDLLARFDEVKDPEAKADNFKKKHKIEYFSQADLKYIVDCLKRKTEVYFNT